MTTDTHITEQQIPSFTLPADPDKALEQMVLTIRHLKDVYDRETAALENADGTAFMAMQEEKFTVAQNYQDGIEQLMARKDDLKTASPALKTMLRDIQKDFSALFERNLEGLDRMNKTMGRLGEKIRSAAMTEANKYRTHSYGETGKVTHDDRKMVSTGMIETA
ncbi:MAG: flagellar protein FlgN [Alphaproteobacteria bacterium]|nr:flagellar protein FlgN [Alphaproteobacteria bacterium]MCD8570253.1 flagellar protein FlgN [Alphaproteobacteria bacterium]